MTFVELKAIAKERGIKVGGVKKTDLVRALQAHEGSEPCFDTGRAAECGQPHCLWIKSCE